VDTPSISRVLSFVRSPLFGDSPYDRFMTEEREALTAVQRLRLDVVRGKCNCSECHVGQIFSDEALHETGVTWQGNQPADEGTGEGRFKTPTNLLVNPTSTRTSSALGLEESESRFSQALQRTRPV
jgi:cytochrome c peroxidase